MMSSGWFEGKRKRDVPSVTSGKVVDLSKEYARFCKLYSAEPLQILTGPLEKASSSEGERASLLDLKGRALRGVDCIAIGKILGNDPPITEINLSDCLLLPQGFQALLDGLGKNRRLLRLHLRGNNIQGPMAAKLGILLQNNATIQTISLDWNSLGLCPESFRLFAEGLSSNQALRVLDLRNNQFSAESASLLASALQKNKTLEELDLRWNSIGVGGARSIWESLRFNFSLRKLSLCGNLIPDSVLHSISTCLAEQSQRLSLMEEYGRKTSLLTRELQKTEETQAEEIKSILSLFEAEEEELKETLKQSLAQIERLTKQVEKEAVRNGTLLLHVEKLTSELTSAGEKEKSLTRNLEMKEEEQSLLRQEMVSLKKREETKINVLVDELETKSRELKEAEKLNGKIPQLQMEIQQLQTQIKEQETEFANILSMEKNKMAEWKREVESTEGEEIRKLKEEIKRIQDSMLNHISTVEKGKREAEEEVSKIKESFCQLESEAREERKKLETHFQKETEKLRSEWNGERSLLQEQAEKMEIQLHDLEAKNGKLLRLNQQLQQHNKDLEDELIDKDSIVKETLRKGREELRQEMEQLQQDASQNKELRAEKLRLEEELSKSKLKCVGEREEREREVVEWKRKYQAVEEQLLRTKHDEYGRASLLQEGILSYLRSTQAATGLSFPTFSIPNTPLQQKTKSEGGDGPAAPLERSNK